MPRTPQFKVGLPEADREKLKKLARFYKKPEAELVRLIVRKELADPRAVAVLTRLDHPEAQPQAAPAAQEVQPAA